MNSCHSRVACVVVLRLTAVGFLWLGAMAGRAMDRYVVEPGTIAPDNSAFPYNTWTNAATNIQWAVDAATNTETVWVSNGVYVLTNQILITNGIILRSTNGPNVTIVNGGYFPGCPVTNRCLSMNNTDAFVHGFTFSNGAYVILEKDDGGGGVLVGSKDISGGILSNCTVCNNIVFSSTNVGTQGGGGVYLWNGTVTCCRVTDNIASNTSAPVGKASGGGIFVNKYWGGTRALISGCLISNNFVNHVPGGAAHGGGIYVYGTAENLVLIRSCQIINNRVTESAYTGYGGGIYSYTYLGVIDSCTISFNRAGAAGGSYLSGGGMITNCVFSNNYSIDRGGIEFPNSGGSVYNTAIVGNTNDGVRLWSSGLMVNCVISNNARYGLDMQGAAGENFVSNCVVRENKNRGVLCYNGSHTVRNCLIVGNAGGLKIRPPIQKALISCCTIASNSAGTDGAGAGIRIEATNAASARQICISSCIISSNGASGGDDVYDNCAPTNYDTIVYSCVGSNRGFTGAGIISNTSPQFADFAAGNYRLAAGSRCVNAGSNEMWMTGTLDLDGRPRQDHFSGKVDMGAYEFLPPGTMFMFH